jgi:hypothetical protein
VVRGVGFSTHLIKIPMQAESEEAASRTRSVLAHSVAQNLFALALLFAASLKAREQLFRQGPATAANAFSSTEIAVEWLLGLWLLSGVARVLARRAAISLLLIFIPVSGWNLLRGKSDCGCFGRVHVHPAITLALDLSALLLIWWFGRGGKAVSTPLCTTFRWGFLRFNRVAVAMTVSVILPGAILMTHGERREKIFVDPHAWLGKPCPVLNWVDATSRDDLARGQRIVILFSHDCDACRKYVPQLAKQMTREIAITRIIDIASESPTAPDIAPPTLRRVPLRSQFQLMGAVPMRIQLQDGIVESADSLQEQ